MNKSFTVLIDTREQHPWNFSHPQVQAKEHIKLDSGDYAVKGYEDILCIERKVGPEEFAGNVVEKRYPDWIKRMSKFPHKFIIFETDVADMVRYPEGSRLPKRIWKKVKINGPYMLACIAQLQVKYGIHVLFCGSPAEAERMAINIMRRVIQYDE